LKARSHRQDKIQVITLGCSKNLVDSEVMMAQLRGNDFDVSHQENIADANIVIINTCGFIDRAKEESIQTILEYAKAKEDKQIDKLLVTGCLSARYKEDLALEIPEVDAWFGTLELPGLLAKLGADYRHELIGERLLTTPAHFAYLKISEGCNRTCSFCAIPLMRGEHVSRTMEDIVQEANYLAAQGVKEIILIAQELTYYGLDIYKKRALSDLLYQLNDVEGIAWIRLHYAYPSKFPLDIATAIRDLDKVCKYLDIPLQHACDEILTSMRRQISRKETEELINTIREIVPGITLRTTMLVGFPGETEAHFAELCAFVQKMRFDRLGVFTYSHEENTAGYMLSDDVPQVVKEERASRLMAIQQEISAEINQSRVGKVFDVLIDRKEGGHFVGRTADDSPEVDNEVLIDAARFFARIGDFAKVLITEATDFDLYGEIIYE